MSYYIYCYHIEYHYHQYYHYINIINIYIYIHIYIYIYIYIYPRSPSQDSPSQDFRHGLGCSGSYFLTGSGVRLSRVWVRKDGNLVMETGGVYIYIYIYINNINSIIIIMIIMIFNMIIIHIILHYTILSYTKLHYTTLYHTTLNTIYDVQYIIYTVLCTMRYILYYTIQSDHILTHQTFGWHYTCVSLYWLCGFMCLSSCQGAPYMCCVLRQFRRKPTFRQVVLDKPFH